MIEHEHKHIHKHRRHDLNDTQRRHWLKGAVAIALPGLIAQARAQTSGTPLRVILPFGAGSGVDTIMRATQGALMKALGGQAVVLENLPGAGGISGTQAIVRAKPDGNTIGIVSNNHAVNPAVYKRMPYDGLTDITPISVLGGSPFLFVVNPAKIAARTAAELQALLKSKPGEFNYASSGNGTIIHLAGEMVVDALGAQVRHIPYKGVGHQITDMIAGHVEMGVVAAPAVMAHIKSGTLHAIGVTGYDRAASFPYLKTFAEQGFKDINISGWFAAVGPADMTQDQVKRVHDALTAAFKDPEVSAAMARQGNTINPGTPIEALMFMRAEQARLTLLAKKADIKLD